MTTLAPLSSQQQAATLSDKEMKKIEATAQDFEAVFITEMLKPMFEMMEVDPFFGGGKGEEVFRDFQLNEYGKMISKQGGIGLAEDVKAQLIHAQLVANGQDAVKNYKYAPQTDTPPVSSLSTTDMSV
jgi:flagellar protein FlgJ